jgi:mRNA interferase MazF
MEGPVKGDVVVIPFPFSNLRGFKNRPAFVLTGLPGEDIILCQITSKAKFDTYALPLAAVDFTFGSLPLDSYVRPNKIFTADKSLILYIAGHVSGTKILEITNAVIALIK